MVCWTRTLLTMTAPSTGISGTQRKSGARSVPARRMNHTLSPATAVENRPDQRRHKQPAMYENWVAMMPDAATAVTTPSANSSVRHESASAGIRL